VERDSVVLRDSLRLPTLDPTLEGRTTFSEPTSGGACQPRAVVPLLHEIGRHLERELLLLPVL
jgi:hypothetical protein